jgi:hypothetical protein
VEDEQGSQPQPRRRLSRRLVWFAIGFVFPATSVGAGFAIARRWWVEPWRIVAVVLILVGVAGLTIGAAVFLFRIVRRVARTPPKRA